MCFSAPVSFATSAVITAAGVGSLKHARKNERLLASMPLLFAAQQIIEGIQWLVLKPSQISTMLGYGFLLFAYLLWPSFMPISLYLAETDAKHRRVLSLFIGLGLLGTTYLFVTLMNEPLVVSELDRCISYGVNVPFAEIGIILYVFIVAGSFVASSRPFFKWFGLIVLLSAVAAWTIYQTTFTSVWCFFAAVLSGCMYLYFRKRHRQTKSRT